MRRESWLDHIVYGFQHQWETKPQYRAAVTGVIGLVVVLTMCSAMLLLSTSANSALAAIGLGAANSAPAGTPNTGTKGVNGYLQFQTPVVTYPPQSPPVVATIPQSQTPLPGPTATDTPQATDTPPPGQQGSCNGGQSGVSWSYSPCSPVHGQTVTLTITSGQRFAGASMAVETSVGTCSDGCFKLWQPTQMGGNGVWSQSWQLPQDASGPTTGNIIFNNGPTLIINGPIVQ
jgi:hypothetical protein